MIRVVIADDHPLLREGVASLISSQKDLTLVGQAGDADSAVALCQKQGPDVALIDLSMPGDGLRAIERISHTCSRTRCLALTMHDDPAYLRGVLAAGGVGYVVKGAASEELIAGIRAVAAGRSHLATTVRAEGLRDVTSAAPDPRIDRLSRRERDVLVGIARGFTSREIADRLGLQTKTVDTYRARLHDKLGVNGRAGLVAYALRAGLLSTDEG